MVNGSSHPMGAANGWSPSGAEPTAAPTATLVPIQSEHIPVIELDFEQVRLLQGQLADALTAVPGFRSMSPEDQRQRARSEVANLVASWAGRYAQAHRRTITPADQRAYEQAVLDRHFGAGRLQPLLDDESVENIFVNGANDVWIDRGNGKLQQVAPVAASDTELIELLNTLGRNHGGGERQVSTSNPLLSMRLADGSRVQVITEAVPRPHVTIRRHRTLHVTLARLVELGMIDRSLHAFLAAAVRARMTIMVVGGQGVGKTSLMRALLSEVPQDERVATLETEYELYLHEDGFHTQVVPLETRQGNGEILDGRQVGEITLADLIPPALRMSLSRLIVGEVRGAEIVPMLSAMTSSEGGSMCTLHVKRGDQTFRRIAMLCQQYSTLTEELAFSLAADALDLIVHVRAWDETGIGGKKHRFVSEVLEVTGIGENNRPATNVIFGPTETEPRAVPRTTPSPQLLAALQRAGFDGRWLDQKGGAWDAPLETKMTVV